MGAKSQRKGASGEQELTRLLRAAGFPAVWGGNRTFGAVPDISGLGGVHIECKRVEHLTWEMPSHNLSGTHTGFGMGYPWSFTAGTPNHGSYLCGSNTGCGSMGPLPSPSIET